MQLKRILVPLAGSSVDVEVLRVAIALGKPAKAEIVAIHVIEVRWNLPLDAILEPESERGEGVLDDAVKVAEQSVRTSRPSSFRRAKLPRRSSTPRATASPTSSSSGCPSASV